MMKALKYFVPAAILALGVAITATNTQAKPEYAKKEGKTCVYCHVKAGSKDLNDAGKYYKEHNHSLVGYQPPKAS